MISGGGLQTDLCPRASQDHNPSWIWRKLTSTEQHKHCRELQRWLNLNHFPRIGIRHERVKESNSLRENVSESNRVCLCTIISFVRLWEGEEITGGGVYSTVGLVHAIFVVQVFITIIFCVCNDIGYCKVKIIMLYMLIPIMTVIADMNA